MGASLSAWQARQLLASAYGVAVWVGGGVSVGSNVAVGSVVAVGGASVAVAGNVAVATVTAATDSAVGDSWPVPSGAQAESTRTRDRQIKRIKNAFMDPFPSICEIMHKLYYKHQARKDNDLQRFCL